MENAANWRTESRTVYSSDFKLRMVELASRPDANVAQLAREHGVDNNLIFKWLRLWQREGRISRRMPATIVGPVVPQSLPASPILLSVDVINDPLPAAENDTLCTFSSAHASATSCHVEFRHGKMTLENPSSELLTVLIRELTGRTQGYPSRQAPASGWSPGPRICVNPSTGWANRYTTFWMRIPSPAICLSSGDAVAIP